MPPKPTQTREASPVTAGAVRVFLSRVSEGGRNAQFTSYGLGLIIDYESSRRTYAPLFFQLVVEQALLRSTSHNGIPAWFNTPDGRRGFREAYLPPVAKGNSVPAQAGDEARRITRLTQQLGSAGLLAIAAEAGQALQDEGHDDAARILTRDVADTITRIETEQGTPISQAPSAA